MKKPKILLVDDEKFVLNSLKRSLRNESYEVTAAQSPDEALDYLEKNPDTAVIIADHRMPRKTGMELLLEVRKKFPTVVRILLTGHADMDVAIQGINEGKLYRFLTKPWDDSELKNHIRNALKFRRAFIDVKKTMEKGKNDKSGGNEEEVITIYQE